MSDHRSLGELIVADDDSAIRDMLFRVLRHDFVVLLAKDGTEAMRLVEETSPIGFLIDEMMPGARGTEVLAKAKSRHPHALRMLMTASTDFDAAVRAINDGEIHKFFSKPLRPVELRRGLIEAVESARAEQLVRAEIRALHAARGGSDAAPEIRALVLGEEPSIVDEIVRAAKSRSLSTRAEGRFELASSMMVARAEDVIVIVRGPDTAIADVVHTARTLDENVAIVVVDPLPQLDRALEAFQLGLTDYITTPLPDERELGRRLERAALHHVTARDTRRITSDLVLANRQLVEARRRTEEEQVRVLNAMIGSLEARDAYTAGHTDRVATIAVRLAETLGHESEKVDRIRVGALLHDLGKIGIRDDVLLKPGRLSPQEFEIIKTHTTIGASLLDGISQFACVLPMIRHHHEKMDGTGYPDGLRGDDIPIEARVVAVADVVDAITSTRPYRKRTSVDDAFGIMNTLSGPHLDPEVMDALRTLHSEERLLEVLQDPDDAPPPGE